MTFETWWMSDENRWSDTRYTKKVAEMAWYAGQKALLEERTEQALPSTFTLADDDKQLT